LPTRADFSCNLWKAAIATLTVFLSHLEHFPPPLETRKSKTLNTEPIRNMENVKNGFLVVQKKRGGDTAILLGLNMFIVIL
jgi:hypothetical protein